MSSQARIVSGFSFLPIGDTAIKACGGRVYASLRSARAGRSALSSQVWGSDRLEIWTCSVEVRDGCKYVKLLEFVE